MSNFSLKNITLIPATLADYPTIQNMARFYVYDRTAYMGWECPENGLFECIDFKHYLENPVEKAFLIKVANEIAGFVFLDKMTLLEPVNWNMGEFFVLAKFQGKGVASAVARQIFKKHPGKWSVAVMPENIRAVKFWRKMIAEVSQGDYTEIFKTADELKSVENPDPYAMNIFRFDTKKSEKIIEDRNILVRLATSVDIEQMVAMSYQKRRDYEKAQPQFWKWAGVDAEALQAKWFAELITRDDHVILVATESHEKIMGFIIGRLMPAPAVYNPGGLTLMIDDYCIENERLWGSVGIKLINEIKIVAKAKKVVQILVVCGAHDKAKSQFLKNRGLVVASEWYVGSIV